MINAQRKRERSRDRVMMDGQERFSQEVTSEQRPGRCLGEECSRPMVSRQWLLGPNWLPPVFVNRI